MLSRRWRPEHPSLSQSCHVRVPGSTGRMWMVVYVGPQRPYVSVINHCPHQWQADQDSCREREGHFQRPQIREAVCESVCLSVRPEGLFITRWFFSTWHSTTCRLFYDSNLLNVSFCYWFVLAVLFQQMNTWIILGNVIKLVVFCILCVNRHYFRCLKGQFKQSPFIPSGTNC